MASKAAAPAAAARGGLLWRLAHGNFDFEDDMYVKLSGIPAPSAPPALRSSAKTVTSSRLSNGLRVASVEMHGHKASVALLVRAGTRCTNAYSEGAPQVLARLAFRGSEVRSALNMQRVLEKYGISGGHAGCVLGRESMTFHIGCSRIGAGWSDGTLAMLESVLRPEFSMGLADPRATDMMRAELDSHVKALRTVATPASAVLDDALHAAAYGDSALGMPLVVDEQKLASAAQLELLSEYISTWYSAPRMLLLGVNVNHNALEQVARMSALPDLPASDAHQMAPESWVGGERRVAHESASGVAYGLNAGERGMLKAKPDDAAVLAVLQEVIDGPSEVVQIRSKVGSASPSHTNLATVLRARPEFSHAKSLSAYACVSHYSDAGMLSLNVLCDEPLPGLDVAVAEIASSGELLGTDLTTKIAAAKKRAAVKVLDALEEPSAVAIAAGLKLVCGAGFSGAREVAAAIEAVTPAAVQDMHSALLQSAHPAIGVLGSASSAVTYDELCGLLASGSGSKSS
eukprot:CAMPEP_0185841066 /NCGR_PEP_ID=MMETSP1353-20130828/17286_1 /TAXON_ID=1077150 /ORGANISM="Erythrolobus australicus, Strain CCMP3124" /LENGTH=515 /DNA_ID=CAMNT_0028540469 /DNA_START=1 /DNA_END=1548 /DNA_ORIENTATION=+